MKQPYRKTDALGEWSELEQKLHVVKKDEQMAPPQLHYIRIPNPPSLTGRVDYIQTLSLVTTGVFVTSLMIDHNTVSYSL